LENQIQLVIVKKRKSSRMKGNKDKHHAEIAKWKALTLEQLTKVVPCDQLLENQGEELIVVLTEARLTMVQLYYQKEQDMVMELNVAHASFWE
jgi:hypothetical protein